MTDLDRAFKALDGKKAAYNELLNYADGNQPLKYSTKRLSEAFRDINCRFVQNWCSVVIDAALDRIVLKGFDVETKAIDDRLDIIWQDNQLQLEAEAVHEAALITHESFIIAWPGEDGIEAFYNDPRLCHVFYASDNPHKKLFACKWWFDEALPGTYLTLYYPDRLEYYVSPGKNAPTSSKSFRPTEIVSAPNPYDTIPVFHFKTHRRSNNGELDNIITLQDAVNKLLSDMMVSAEFGAWMQRWIITNGDVTAIKNAPYENYVLPAGDGQGQQTSVGQFQATDLNNFLNAIDKLANSIAIISRTPKHYFYNSGTALSGEALLAMEAPLNKKVLKFEESFGVVWQELAQFLLLLDGAGDVDRSTIKPIWEPPQSIQPYTEAQTRKLSVDTGIPLVTELKREGWSETDISGMQKDEEDAKGKSTSMAQALLQQARVNQEQSNQPPTQTGGMNGNLT